MICEVLGCTNRTTDKQKGVFFCRFPHNEIVNQKWVDILSRDGWSPNPLGKVCSAHFQPTDILKNSAKKVLLTETAVPSILPPLNVGISSEPISKISTITVDDEIKGVSTNDTFLNPEDQLAATTNESESITSKFSVICELAADVNSIKSKINLHLRTRRKKNCRMKAKIEKLKRFLIEIKDENTNNNPALACLFENALREPPDTAIYHQLNDHHFPDRSIEEEPSQPAELTQHIKSVVEGTINNPFVLNLTNELKKLYPEDFTLIKRDIHNILKANNNK